MRKNTARHWLHAVLDLLPVLLIPVFMIYSHRHTLTERTEVDIQYKYETNDVNSYDDLVLGNIYHLDSLNMYDNGFDNSYTISIYKCASMQIEYFSSYELDELMQDEYNSLNDSCLSINWNVSDAYITYTSTSVYATYYYADLFINFTDVDFIISINLDNFIDNMEDLGNLPSSSDFNVIESVDVQDTNSNIMSVFMDNFNSTISTYFNLGNVFNMNDVYNWFNINIFNGNAPTVIYSVYNIIVYEFLMDMLFLLYAVFMFIIDFAESFIERMFDKSRCGGR